MPGCRLPTLAAARGRGAFLTQPSVPFPLSATTGSKLRPGCVRADTCTMTRPLLLALVAASLSGALAVPEGAVGALSQQDCLGTPYWHPSTANLVRGLGLSGDQKRAVRVRLAQYTTATASRFLDLSGLDLSGDQIAEIHRRWSALTSTVHPAGWPCKPFKNPNAVIGYVRQLLVANGFRPASLRFFKVSPRQVRFGGIQDGESLGGAIARIGPRRIAIRLSAPGFGKDYEFNIGFDA